MKQIVSPVFAQLILSELTIKQMCGLDVCWGGMAAQGSAKRFESSVCLEKSDITAMWHIFEARYTYTIDP